MTSYLARSTSLLPVLLGCLRRLGSGVRFLGASPLLPRSHTLLGWTPINPVASDVPLFPRNEASERHEVRSRRGEGERLWYGIVSREVEAHESCPPEQHFLLHHAEVQISAVYGRPALTTTFCYRLHSCYLHLQLQAPYYLHMTLNSNCAIWTELNSSSICHFTSVCRRSSCAVGYYRYSKTIQTWER